jgi:hypothetical protein
LENITPPDPVRLIDEALQEEESDDMMSLAAWNTMNYYDVSSPIARAPVAGLTTCDGDSSPIASAPKAGIRICNDTSSPIVSETVAVVHQIFVVHSRDIFSSPVKGKKNSRRKQKREKTPTSVSGKPCQEYFLNKKRKKEEMERLKKERAAERQRKKELNEQAKEEKKWGN